MKRHNTIMPDFYLLTFLVVGGFFLTLVGLHIRLMSRVASLEVAVANLTKHSERLETDLGVQKKEKERDNLSLWKEIADMKSTLTEAVTLLKTTTVYMQETLKRHEILFEKIDKKLS